MACHGNARLDANSWTSDGKICGYRRLGNRGWNYGVAVRYQLTDPERLEACGEDPSWICDWVADRTGSVGLTRAVQLVVEVPLRILIIIVVALLVSRLLRRFIDRYGSHLAQRSLERLATMERRAPSAVRRGARASRLAATAPAQPATTVAAPTEAGPVSTSDARAQAVGPQQGDGPQPGERSGPGDRRVGEPGDADAVPGSTTPQAPATNGRLKLRIDTLVAVLSSLSTVAVWAVAGVVILGQFDVSLAPLFAGAGVLGVALGFGAQSVVSDFLSGFFMLFEDQFGVGDVVDLGEASGTVENLSLRTTTIRDVNGTVWHIRNSEIRRVGNKSQLWSRAVIDVDVAYDTDIRRAEGIIQWVADELWRDPSFVDGDIIDPPEVWGVENLGADGVTIRLVVRTDPAEQWIVGRELRVRIKEALDEAGIEMPFPQRTVWLRHDETMPRTERPDVAVAPLRIPAVSDDLVQNPD